jgi:hypothetical protein
MFVFFSPRLMVILFFIKANYHFLTVFVIMARLFFETTFLILSNFDNCWWQCNQIVIMLLGQYYLCFNNPLSMDISKWNRCKQSYLWVLSCWLNISVSYLIMLLLFLYTSMASDFKVQNKNITIILFKTFKLSEKFILYQPYPQVHSSVNILYLHDYTHVHFASRICR